MRLISMRCDSSQTDSFRSDLWRQIIQHMKTVELTIICATHDCRTNDSERAKKKFKWKQIWGQASNMHTWLTHLNANTHTPDKIYMDFCTRNACWYRVCVFLFLPMPSISICSFFFCLFSPISLSPFFAQSVNITSTYDIKTTDAHLRLNYDYFVIPYTNTIFRTLSLCVWVCLYFAWM